MIRSVGLLSAANIHRIGDAYALCRQRDASADTAQAQAFRARYSRDITIKFLGVWDTVGALGIPLPAMHWLNQAEYAFHDTQLSKIVENAAHAVAVDEHRIDYQVSLWDPPDKGWANRRAEMVYRSTHRRWWRQSKPAFVCHHLAMDSGKGGGGRLGDRPCGQTAAESRER
jgi:uncharacterized protein (DUF2235 family)